MASDPTAPRGASNRQLILLAVALVAALPVALYALFGGALDTGTPVRLIAKLAGAPTGGPPATVADRRPRLGIVRIEAKHIRAGGLKPGDQFDALVTVRNYGAHQVSVRVDVLREPSEILPFRSAVQSVPPNEDRVFKLQMTASARYIIARHYLRQVYLVSPHDHGVAAFTDATPLDNGRMLRVPVGLYVDLEVTTVRPGRFQMDLRKGRYRASRQAYEITITNRGTARYERGARFDLSLYTEQNPRSLTRWSRAIDKAIEPGERITINGSFVNLWQHPPWIQEQSNGLFEGPALPGFSMRLIAIVRLPLDLDPARRNNELDTRFLIGMEPIRREKSRMLFEPMRIRSGRLGFTDQ
ncbi:MAG TPA: hypothetical protein VM325_09835 [Alphaproteobacteria bacterium]|nr:hypothetical protein [Alphaproteobacteria bacterium]